MLRLSGCNRLRTLRCRLERGFSNLNHVETEGEIVIDPKTNKHLDNAKEKQETPANSSTKPFKSTFKVYDEHSPRFNDFNIQMIPKSMCDLLFGKNPKSTPCNLQELNKAILELKKHGLMSDMNGAQDVKLNLPKLEGKTIDDHFYNIGEKQCGSYRNLVLHFLSGLPKVPTCWELKEGWTKYTEDGTTSVDFPDEDVLVFDVEVCCSEGQMPTIATAVSSTAWYAWVSSRLINNSKSAENHHTLDQLIPLESTDSDKGYNFSEKMMRPRIVIGHNVSYDRARVKEQYWLERTGLRFLDTLSLHVSVSGVTSYQRNLLKAGLGQDNEWSKLSSLNNLSKVHNLYCGSELSKEERDIFVKGTISDVLDNFQSLVSYCANDVLATHNVLCKLFPMFLDRFPHPVSLAGILELGLAYLPINSSWNQYISDCNAAYDDLDHEAKQILIQLADDACQLLHDDAYKKHLWLWDQDWSVRNLALKKKAGKKEVDSVDTVDNDEKDSDLGLLTSNEKSDYEVLLSKFKSLLGTEQLLPLKPPHLPGYPAWYTKLCPKLSSPEWSPGPQLISTSMQIAPKLLSLTWQSLPLHYVRGHGWGMLVPYKTDVELENIEQVPMEQLVLYCQNIQSDLLCKCSKLVKDEHIEFKCDTSNLKSDPSKGTPIFCRSEMGSGCGLVKLPHKDGKHLNVGNPLARDYIHKFSKDSLGGGDEKTERLIEISKMLSYWRNNKERVESQIAVWLGKKDIPTFMKTDVELGAILPQVTVSGTLTRRAVEPTWMTASNALSDRVGSELRAIVTAPPSYFLVGADVDSQELWIASIIGDAYSYNHHGSTPFGWMTLSGKKSDGTDMHSVTAKAIGISRNQAKVINYARIYGAGQPFAEHLLKQFNPDMSSSEARQKASKMFSMTKGKRIYILKKHILPDIRQRTYTKYGAREVCSLYGKGIDELFEVPKWIGGTESAMFNRLEEIASDPEPKTPFLKGRLSRALEPGTDADDKFIPTRVNWVVQSGAVDFLHLMLVCMRWLLGPNIRFCLSFHDEVRYLVPQNLRYQAALALHVTNLYTRAFCISQLGMIDVPLSVAFFSSVEVDTVLRKEADLDCKTPSNPFGLSKGYGVPPGESLNIEEAIRKARGTVGLPCFRSKRKSE
ncbi:DNA polymerase subunit gamma-1, mitochondrial [Macrosteles quadrilineatus]|uniref:DNA polymerase subunit gamma-1, mitochondrial n=1 Tax=Macrosteles quadrilineatus TaxID=74068 RepID=UPI0023E11800|nr:DNA polymerase subunit gamma-1, mitochondrial [Macrosteles quadrilineatus]